MKNKMFGLLVLAAGVLFAAGAMAQDNPAPAGSAPATDQSAPASPSGKMTKEQKKAAWESGVKQDCSAEIGTGGVCAGKDFNSGLMDCLHKNRKSLSDGCKVAIHKRHHMGMHKMHKGMNKGAESQQTPNAPAPTNPPSNQ